MKKTFTIFLLLFFLFFVSASPVLAGIWDGVDCNEQGKGPCTFCDMIKVGANIIDFLVQLTFAIGALAIVIGAGMMILSAGSEKRYTQGKNFITNAVIGIFIAVVSWLIVNEIFHLITGSADIPWNEITCQS